MFHKALYFKTLKDHARGIIGWMFGVVFFITIQLAVYPTIRASSEDWSTLTESFPDAIKKVLRMTDYSSEIGYLSAELLSFLLPFIFIGLGCTWGARLATEDEESGAADILLSLPITRASVLITRSTAAVTAQLLTSVVLTLSLGIGARLLGMSIAINKFISAAVVLFLLSFVMMSLACLFGTVSGRRTVALGVSMSVAIFAFIFYSLAPLVTALESALPYNPMQWTIGTDPLRSGVDLGYSIWLIIFSIVFLVSSLQFFNRRDIST